jgi:hypothetical protein
MLSLVGKDLRAGALYFAVKVPVLGLFLAEALIAGKGFVVVSSVTAAIFVVVASALDWSVGAEPFVHSLPVSRSDVVRARYATFVLLAGAWLTLAAITAMAFASMVVAHGGVWPVWVGFDGALTAVLYVGVFIPIFLTCVFRFGMGKGGVVATMILAVLAPVGIRVVRPEAVAGLMATAGTVPVAAGVVLTIGLLIWLSMKISVHHYEHREF